MNNSKSLLKNNGNRVNASQITSLPLASGVWFAPQYTSQVNTTASIPSGTMFFRMVHIQDDITLNGILVNVSANATPTTGAVIGLTLYSLSYSAGLPVATKIADLGTLGIDTIGVKTASTTPINVSSGYYLLGYQHNNATAVTFSVMTADSVPQIPTGDVLNRIIAELSNTLTYTYPAPSTVSSFTTSTNTTTLHVKFKVA